MTPERRAVLRELANIYLSDEGWVDEIFDDNERLERELAELKITLAGHEFLEGMGEAVEDEI